MSAISVKVVNPVFEKKSGKMAAKYFGAVATDLSNCLHQISNFVAKKFGEYTTYGFKANDNICHEEMRIELDGDVFVISLKQDNVNDSGFADVTRLEPYTLISVFDSFMERQSKSELKKLSSYYRVFLKCIARGNVYCGIKETEKTLIMQIGKYEGDFKKIQTQIRIEIA